ncbi:uncharacterized protein LODBEIA_P40960 [Lodderomyces beijingensis]|uniref:t-SNARE coiled-coil homology domain-containing protein n=1 Tax=Lodderomyces beijingensis TaxID=1775926 RepID=A0ABP0ZUB4_9ASCO
MVSIQAAETIVDNYSNEITQLNLPTLKTLHHHHHHHDGSNTNTMPYLNTSPYIAKFKLQLLQNSLLQILSQLNNDHSKSAKTNKSLMRVKLKLEHLLVDEIDEKLYVVDELIKLYNFQNTPPVETEPLGDLIESNPNTNSNSNLAQKLTRRSTSSSTTITGDENLLELKQRLLSNSTKHQDTAHQHQDDDPEKLNAYHESLQEDILHELSQLTSSLKQSAITLSSKILSDDLHILNETNENMIKNSNLFKVIDRNLNHYLENKTGNRISLWFLLKLIVVVVAVFIVMVLFVGVVPRIL